MKSNAKTNICSVTFLQAIYDPKGLAKERGGGATRKTPDTTIIPNVGQEIMPTWFDNMHQKYSILFNTKYSNVMTGDKGRYFTFNL